MPQRVPWPGELIAAQPPRVLVMHDPGHGSQVQSCSREPPRAAISTSVGVRTLTTTAWALA
ncbi:MAG: hypothetical protein ACRDNS_28830, partial [Trebonia sp.]